MLGRSTRPPPAGGGDAGGASPAAAGPAHAPRFRPLYQQIKEALLAGIAGGEWPPGGAIPSEFELAARFGVSQGTVRKAVEALALDGLLVRRQGKGTFVASHGESRAQFRFLRLRPDDGPAIQPTSRILACRRLRAPADVARPLGLRAGDSALFLQRLLEFDGVPVVLDDIWLAGEQFRRLTLERLAGHTGQLYALLESELGTKMIHASERLRAVAATPAQADVLRVAAGSPLLLVERVTSTFNGQAVELRRGRCRTDHHHYANEL